jgi:hypothetical protein
MARKGDIFLGPAGAEQLLSPFGRQLTIADTELSRQERSSNGTLRKEIIAVKKKFTLAYSLIDGADLIGLVNLYNTFSELSLKIYKDDVNFDSYTVLMNPIDRTRALLSSTGLWSGVSVEMEEV